MGSSFLNNDKQKSQNIFLCCYSDETHASLKYQNNYNCPSIEEKCELITSKLQNTQINENNNSIKPKINILSDQSIVSTRHILAEEEDYEISTIKDSDKEKYLLINLCNIFKQEGPNKNSVIIKFNNGEKYIGEWDSQNHRDGLGIQIFKNNYIYYGYWENNKMNGIGKMIKFSQKINDLGIIFNENIKPYYFGNWKNNLEDGEGEEIWIDNSIYKGEFKEGFKQGHGILILPDGSEYEGEFSHGQIEGKGKMKFNDGRIYEGNWMNNKMNGEGIFNWPDGRSYKGNYLNNNKNGFGEFTWSDGKIYKGMWENGIQNGKGKFYDREYDIWINGIWKNGIRLKKKV